MGEGREGGKMKAKCGVAGCVFWAQRAVGSGLERVRRKGVWERRGCGGGGVVWAGDKSVEVGGTGRKRGF